eukprot:TRINITY_DN56315_c0_g1_i1.p1 TRINITY_DN56315_c0_g1~~TRINITY_DN56315_c0_g1_i1.p1  ORF type:complete len:526 (+),score=107.80 TRINITY_DN56315_c0_g1_i1:26-1579(+)
MVFLPYPRFPDTGYVDCLDAEQRDALDRLRDRARRIVPKPSPGSFIDLHLLRFLRARCFDVDSTEELITAFMRFREENKLDDPESSPPSPRYLEARKKYYPSGWHGVDIHGRPVHIERLGEVDAEALIAAGSAEKLKSTLIREYEDAVHRRLPAASLSKGSLVEHTFCVVDLDGLRLGSLSRRVVRQTVLDILQLQQMYYPEVMGETFIINTPFAFSAVWRLIGGILGEQTKQKLRVFSSSESESCFEALRAMIPEENLPSTLGGQCLCKVPGGCLRSDIGPWHEAKVARSLQRRPGWHIQFEFSRQAGPVAPLDDVEAREAGDFEPCAEPVQSAEVAVEARGENGEDDLAVMTRLQWEVSSADAELWRSRVVEARLEAELQWSESLAEAGVLAHSTIGVEGRSREGSGVSDRDCDDPALLAQQEREELASAVRYARLHRDACQEVFRGKMHFYRRAKAEVEELHRCGRLAASSLGSPREVIAVEAWHTPVGSRSQSPLSETREGVAGLASGLEHGM